MIDQPGYIYLMRLEEQLALAEYRLAGEWFRPIPQWVNWFRTLSQYFIDEGEYPSHEPYVFGRSNDHY
jgi:hypothetical protein